MKNFSKKLSFVMATAMVVTSLYAPQNAEAAAKNVVVRKGSTKAVKSKNIYLSGKTVDFDAMIKGNKVKDSAGKWTSSNKKVATVNKNGVVKVTGAGTATIKFTDKKSKKTASVKIYGRVRAAKMMLTPAAVMVKEGESADVAVSYELSKKVQAAGGKATTYKLFAESSDDKVATVSVDGNNKVMVKGVAKSATPATITVYAAQVNDLAKAKEVKIKLTEKFDVKVSSKLEAKQAGANKIKVMGTDLVASKSAYVIKNANGGILELKNEVKVNAEKTEADLETVTGEIPAGKYTLTYNNGDAVEFEVVKAVVKSIEIAPSGSAIMSSDGKKAYVYYKVLDQFGNDVTKSPVVNLRINSSDKYVDGRGKITFEAKDQTKGYQLNWDKISVSIVDVNTGVATNALLTVGEKAKIVDAKYEKIYNVSKREIVDSITDADKLANFKLLFTAKDQYGNDYVVDGGGKELVVNLLGTTGVTVDSNNVTVIEYKGKEYYAYQLKNISDTTTQTNETASRSGEVTLQAVSINNGKTIAEKFNVVAASKVDTLKVWEGNDGIYNGKKNELSFAAYDANGKEITSWDSLKKLNDKPLNDDKARFYFARKDDGKVGLYYDLEKSPITGLSGTDTLPVPVIFRTMTDKFTNVTLNVKAKKTPVAIVGLKSDFAKGVVAGNALTVKADDFRYQDQFGNLMTAEEVVASSATDYKVALHLSLKKDKDGKASFDHDGDGNGHLKANEVSTKAGIVIAQKDTPIVELKAGDADNDSPSVTVKAQLLDKDGKNLGEEKSFKFYAVPLAKMNSFEVKVPKLVAAANVKDIEADTNNLAKSGFEVEAVGRYAGEEIKLTNATDFTVLNPNANDKKNANVPSIDDEKTVVKKTAKVAVAIADGKGTTVEKEYTYTNEKRVVAKAKVKTSPVSYDFRTAKGWSDIESSFEIKDQYDVVVNSTVKPNITLSDLVDGITLEDAKKNGTNEVKIKTTDTNAKMITLKLTFNGSNYVFDQVVTFKSTN